MEKLSIIKCMFLLTLFCILLDLLGNEQFIRNLRKIAEKYEQIQVNKKLQFNKIIQDFHSKPLCWESMQPKTSIQKKILSVSQRQKLRSSSIVFIFPYIMVLNKLIVINNLVCFSWDNIFCLVLLVGNSTVSIGRIRVLWFVVTGSLF